MITQFFSELPITQKSMAESLDVDQTAISRWATGRTQPTRTQIWQALHVVEDALARYRDLLEETRLWLQSQPCDCHLHEEVTK